MRGESRGTSREAESPRLLGSPLLPHLATHGKCKFSAPYQASCISHVSQRARKSRTSWSLQEAQLGTCSSLPPGGCSVNHRVACSFGDQPWAQEAVVPTTSSGSKF